MILWSNHVISWWIGFIFVILNGWDEWVVSESGLFLIDFWFVLVSDIAHWVSNYDSTIYIWLWFYVMGIWSDYGYGCVFWSCMSSQSSFENSLLSYIDTDRGISRAKFFEEGENCNIPTLIGNPNCAGSWFWAQCVWYLVYWTANWPVLCHL